jgi:A/G-specific adenine glycosylase
VAQTCFANKNNVVNALPVKSKKAKQRKRYFYFYYIENGNYLFLEKRTGKDIWQNLYQFPLIETKKELSDVEILKNRFTKISDLKGNIKSISAKRKHILTHQIIYARVIHIEIKNKDFKSDEFIRVNKKDIHKFAVPRLVEQFFKDLGIE